MSSVVSTVSSSFLGGQRTHVGLCTPTDTWRTHPVLLRAHSLHNGALFHGKPHPVLALGSIALPVGVCIAVCQAGHIELLLGRDRGVESVFTPFPALGVCFGSGRRDDTVDLG